MLGVMSNMLLLISTFRNPVPRAGCILHGTLRRGLGPVIIVGGVSGPNTHITRIRSRILRLFVRLSTASRRLSFPIICTGNHSNVTGCSVSSSDSGLRPLFGAVVGCYPYPGNSTRNPLRFVIAALSCSSCINGVTVNHVIHNGVRPGRGIIIASNRNRHGTGVNHICACRNLGQIRRSRTTVNRVTYVINVPSLGVNRAIASPRGPRTLPGVGVSRPALSVVFCIGSDPFTNRRKRCIADHRLHSHLFHRIRAGMSLHIRRASDTSTFGMSNHNRLRVTILVRRVHHRNCRLRVNGPDIVAGRVGNRGYRPLRTLAVSIPPRFVNTIVRGLNAHGTRVIGVASVSNCAHLRFVVPTHNLVNFHDRFLATAGKGNVVCRIFRNCTP